MPVNHFVSAAALATFAGLAASSAMATITIATIPIGNLGNAADPATGNAYGSVAFSYNIAFTEVTNAQYAAFLTAVAATDTNDLYNPNMAGEFGGIIRSWAHFGQSQSGLAVGNFRASPTRHPTSTV